MSESVRGSLITVRLKPEWRMKKRGVDGSRGANFERGLRDATGTHGF